MADTSLILALPSFRNLWLFPMAMLSISPNCWSRSWASQHLVEPFTLRLLMNTPNASCMTRAMHGMWFPNAGSSIPEAWSVGCSSHVIQSFAEALSVVIPSKRPSVSSKSSITSFQYLASFVPVLCSLTYHLSLVFGSREEYAINLVEREFNFPHCPISIHIIRNNQSYG